MDEVVGCKMPNLPSWTHWRRLSLSWIYPQNKRVNVGKMVSEASDVTQGRP